MDVNFEDWSFWATENKVHPRCYWLLNLFKADLFDFDPKTSSQSFATSCPWNFVSEILNTEGFDTASDFEQKAEIAGAIGEGMAIKFCEHRKIASKLPIQKMFLMVKSRSWISKRSLLSIHLQLAYVMSWLTCLTRMRSYLTKALITSLTLLWQTLSLSWLSIVLKQSQVTQI